jgi:hypothetical protein
MPANISAATHSDGMRVTLEGLWDAARKEYKGPLVIGKDLMAIDVGKTVTWHGKSANSTLDVDKPKPS